MFEFITILVLAIKFPSSLFNFFSNLLKTNVYDPRGNVSKQGFSVARQKIAPEAFVKMSDEIIKWFYKDNNFKRYKGYRLLSIDGTILEISNTEDLRNKFGYIENQCMKVARARASGLYDVENDMIIASVLDKII